MLALWNCQGGIDTGERGTQNFDKIVITRVLDRYESSRKKEVFPANNITQIESKSSVLINEIYTTAGLRELRYWG